MRFQICSSCAESRPSSGQTTDQSSWLKRSGNGSLLLAPRPPSSSQGAQGRTDTARASTAGATPLGRIVRMRLQGNGPTAERGDLLLPARRSDHHRRMEAPLQHQEATQCAGLPPTGSRKPGHNKPGADHTLTIRLGHSDEAAHSAILRSSFRASSATLALNSGLCFLRFDITDLLFVKDKRTSNHSSRQCPKIGE